MNSLQVRRRQILARDQDARRFRDQPDRREIGDGIVGRLLVQRLAEGLGAAIADQDRVAVGRPPWRHAARPSCRPRRPYSRRRSAGRAVRSCFCAWMRALTSTPPPAENGTIERDRPGRPVLRDRPARRQPVRPPAPDRTRSTIHVLFIIAPILLIRRNAGGLDGAAPGFDLASTKRCKYCGVRSARRRQAGAELLEPRLHRRRRHRGDARRH